VTRIVELVGGPADGDLVGFEGSVGHTIRVFRKDGSVLGTYRRDLEKPAPAPGEPWEFDYTVDEGTGEGDAP